MALDSNDIESIKGIFSDRMDRLEARFVDEMEKIVVKVDQLSDNFYKTSERVTRLESTIIACDSSRAEQGKRIGDLEKEVAVIKEVKKEAREIGRSSTDWIKWVAGSIIAIALAAAGYFVNK